MFLEDSLVRLGDAWEERGWGIEGYREGMVGRVGRSVGESMGWKSRAVCPREGYRLRGTREASAHLQKAEEGDLSGASILGDGNFLGVVEDILDDLLGREREDAVSGAERGAPAGNYSDYVHSARRRDKLTHRRDTRGRRGWRRGAR